MRKLSHREFKSLGQSHIAIILTSSKWKSQDFNAGNLALGFIFLTTTTHLGLCFALFLAGHGKEDRAL